VIGEVRGIEYAPITFEIADDLGYWAVSGGTGRAARASTSRSTGAGPVRSR
jgi:hypothetical protein